MARINVIEVKIGGEWKTAIEAWRVKYGKPGQMIDLREYTIYPGSPVGCMAEVEEFAKTNYPEVDGVLFCDPISNCTHYKAVGGALKNMNIRGK